MIVLGVDPGATTGWCLCRTNQVGMMVMGNGHFPKHEVDDELRGMLDERLHLQVAIERPVAHGATYPQVVEAALTAGRLIEKFARHFTVVELTRQEIRARLQLACNGAIRVKDDASVWAALKALHGGDSSAKKGGKLYGVRSHARAALAAAVAFGLPSTKEQQSSRDAAKEA